MSGHVKVRLSWTLFVENFPFLWNNIALRECFEKYCKVLDAYVAHKLSKRKAMFGFIRVDGLVDVHALIQVMNGSVVGKNKLFVGLSKFSKAPKPTTKSGDVRPEIGLINGNKSRVSTTKTFAEALQGRMEKRNGVATTSTTNKGLATVLSTNAIEALDISVSSPLIIDEWLERSAVCTLEGSQLEVFKEDLINIGVKGAMVRPLSGEDVLITFPSTGEMESFLGPVQNLCKKCEPWTIYFIPSTRSVWVQILGLPLHMWSEDIMRRLVAPIGNLVTLHRETSEKKRLDAAWVLLSVSSPEKIKRHLRVSVQGIFYPIYISECPSMVEGSSGGTTRPGSPRKFRSVKENPTLSLIPVTVLGDGNLSSSTAEQLMENGGVSSPRGDNLDRNIESDICSPLSPSSETMGDISEVPCSLPSVRVPETFEARSPLSPASETVGDNSEVPGSLPSDRVPDTFEAVQKDANVLNPTKDVLGPYEDQAFSKKAKEYRPSTEASNEEKVVTNGEGQLGLQDRMEVGQAIVQKFVGPVRNSIRERKLTAKGLAFNCSTRKKVAFTPRSNITSPVGKSSPGQPEARSPGSPSCSKFLEASAIKASLIGKRLGIVWDAEEEVICTEIRDALVRGRLREKAPSP